LTRFLPYVCFSSFIAGAISKKIPGGKQLVDKISSIVDKKKKVRTSKVGDKVITPNDKDFTPLKNGNWKNKHTGEILICLIF
jgi:hypothetical protein